jgi:hypothetical protein
MATGTNLVKEREMLSELGVAPVKIWPARCTWYRPDGTVLGNLPCDPYSRMLYMSRGFRPDITATATRVVRPTPKPSPVVLIDALINMVRARETWEGTAGELLAALRAVSGTASGLPVDPTRMGKKLRELASQLATNGITVQEMKRGRNRGYRLDARAVSSNPST